MSVVCIATFNNLRNENWTDARLKFQAERQNRWLSKFDSTEAAKESFNTRKLLSATNLSREEQKEIQDFTRSKGIQTVGELREYIKGFRQASIELVKTEIPIAGLTFDANDLGLVLGMSLVIFSVFLFKSLRRERRATISCFEEATRSNELELAYSLMSLEEVLMRPDNLYADKDSEFSTFNVSRTRTRLYLDALPIQSIIAAAPLVCLSLIIFYDMASLPIGFAQSQVSTSAVLFVEVCCAILLAVIVSESFRVVNEMTAIWKLAHELVLTKRTSTPQVRPHDFATETELFESQHEQS